MSDDETTATAPPKNPTFLVQNGEPVECADEYAADLASEDGARRRQLHVRSKSGQPYHHVAEDLDGNWIYRQGH